MTQDVAGEETEAAREDLWLTYQNYDPAVKQAVRRLGALPGDNVEEFRRLFLASRERKRVKEFEDDVVRRLQGEAFVGDEVLQQTLIVLHAENPGLAEQFKQFVAANGRPDDIDLTVARLRSGSDNPVMPERMPRKPREPANVAPEPVAAPAVEMPAPEIAAPKAPPPRPRVSPPAPPPMSAIRVAPPEAPEAKESSQGYWAKRVAAIAAVLLIAAAGAWLLASKSTTAEKSAFKATTVPLRQAAAETAEEKAPPAAAPAQAPRAVAPVSEPAPNPPAETAQVSPAAPQPVTQSLQAAPAEAQTRSDMQPPAQDTESSPAANTSSRPVPDSQYRVVKGDMLSVIAQQAYGNASLYPMIQRANPSLRNANRIYYDQVITLPPKP